LLAGQAKIYKSIFKLSYMQIEILKDEKHEVDVQMSNVTIVELLRIYLQKEGVDFVAWRRDHPSKPAVMKIRSAEGVSKSVKNAVSAIEKDLKSLSSAVKGK